MVLERVLCIYYQIQFKKDTNETQIQALIDSSSEINTIATVYISKLGF